MATSAEAALGLGLAATVCTLAAAGTRSSRAPGCEIADPRAFEIPVRGSAITMDSIEQSVKEEPR
jgi:hypothetical protein